MVVLLSFWWVNWGFWTTGEGVLCGSTANMVRHSPCAGTRSVLAHGPLYVLFILVTMINVNYDIMCYPPWRRPELGQNIIYRADSTGL